MKHKILCAETKNKKVKFDSAKRKRLCDVGTDNSLVEPQKRKGGKKWLVA